MSARSRSEDVSSRFGPNERRQKRLFKAEALLTSEGPRTIHLLCPHNRDVRQDEVSAPAAWLAAKLPPRFGLSDSPVEM